jgi:preprotein translocase subunit Sss1
MQRIAESKVTLVQNLLYPRWYHILNVWRIPDWQHNEAFRFIPAWWEPWKLLDREKILVPQLKSRVFEAAFGRSLILCKRDPFNVIERYFTPNKEFIYFEEGQLEEKLEEILSNYRKYQRVIDAAFDRAKKEYTTKAFVQKYLKKLL